jgi:catalase
MQIDQAYKEPPFEDNSRFVDWYDRNCDGENDHFSQSGNLFKIMSAEQQQSTINKIVTHMSWTEGPKKHEINRQLSLWYRVDGFL